jgi:hypothetical protein
MSKLAVYDPAQCCATGACSPDADDQLAQFASALEWLKSRGVEVARYNLGHQPAEFAQNAAVRGAIEQEGIDVLPLIMADGRIVSKGRYPNRAELSRELGLAVGVGVPVAAAASSCCAPAAATADSKCCG